MRLIVAVLCVLLISAPRALAQKRLPDDERAVAHVGSFTVFSDGAVSDARAAAIVSRVAAAWQFVIDEQRWGADPELGPEVRVRVVSDERMKSISPRAKGVTKDKDTFVVAASFLDEERSERTLAHELTHLQDRRHLAAVKNPRIPHWFREGRAVAMGRAYEAKLGLLDRKYDRSIARIASR